MPYTTKSGDYLGKIAQQVLGDWTRWPEIYNLNRDVIGSNPDVVRAGVTLRIPGEDVPSPNGTAPTPSSVPDALDSSPAAQVQRILANYNWAGKYQQRAANGELSAINQDVDFLTDHWVGQIAESNGLELPRSTLRHFADAILAHTITQDQLLGRMQNEHDRINVPSGGTPPVDIGLPGPGLPGPGDQPVGTPGPGFDVVDTGPTPEQLSARGYLNGLLDFYGLGSLSGWAWDQILAGNPAEMVIQELRERPEYKQRFPAMEARRNAGLSPITEAEYIQLESSYRSVMLRGQLPSGFYDSKDDFTDLISKDISPELISERIQEGYLKVAFTAPEVRNAFSRYYGVAGDAALAAMFIDPDAAHQVLLDQASAAVAGGIAERVGFTVGRDLAEEITAFDPSTFQLESGFQQADLLRPVARETVSESVDIIDDDLIRAQFGVSSADAAAVRRRLETRRAAFSGGGGSAATNRGFLGLGTA